MSAVGELLQAHCLEGLSPLVGGCEQEYNVAVVSPSGRSYPALPRVSTSLHFLVAVLVTFPCKFTSNKTRG